MGSFTTSSLAELGFLCAQPYYGNVATSICIMACVIYIYRSKVYKTLVRGMVVSFLNLATITVGMFGGEKVKRQDVKP